MQLQSTRLKLKLHVCVSPYDAQGGTGHRIKGKAIISFFPALILSIFDLNEEG